MDIDELLDLPPPLKKERICDEEKEEVQLQKVVTTKAYGILKPEEFDIDNYMQHQHTTTEPTLEFSVTPHRKTIGLRNSEVVTQICASIKAYELPVDINGRAPVDIVVALDVSGSMVSHPSDYSINLLLRPSPLPSSSLLLSSVLRSLIYVKRLLNYSFTNFTMMIDSVSFHSLTRQR